MKEEQDKAKQAAASKKEQAEQNYPDFILPMGAGEDSDEECNPMAYTLLSKIKDPYYLKHGPPTPPPDIPEDEEKSSLGIYKAFYDRPTTKSESSRNSRCLKRVGVITSRTGEEKYQHLPLKKVTERVFQEPKRHYSEKVFPHASPYAKAEETEAIEKSQTTTSLTGAPAKSATQFYKAQLHRPSGVSTPPPMSYQNYPQPPGLSGYSHVRPGAYPASTHYSTNTLPQSSDYIRSFQQLQLNEPQYIQPQYVQTPTGFYPMYYPPTTAHMPGVMYTTQPPPAPGLYQPAPFAPTKGLKRKSLTKPSQFRPAESFEPPEHGEHKAANEDYILSIIQEFLEQDNDTNALKGKVVTLALTQTGSRFLQKQLTKANPNFVAFVLKEVEDDLPELMVDDYGNYFCQRLVSSCSPPQRIGFLSKIKGKIVQISKDKKGTHTIQAMLDVMTMKEEEEIMAGDIEGHVFELASDQQATHVVQKALLTFTEERKKFIIEEALDNFVKLANDANGLCLIKKVIPAGAKDLPTVKRIVEVMSKNAIELVQNPYGNYAIQVALESFTTPQTDPILVSLKGKYAQLSMLKFSSNVVEKCIEKAEGKRREEILKEIANSDKLLALMKNNFGNYVVQKALSIAEGDVKAEVGMAIKENIAHLTDKKLKAKWTQILNKSLNL